MTVAVRFRDAFRKYVPPWLSDRPSSAKTVGFRFLWSMIAPLDAAADVLVQGIQAAWPGLGTATALPLIARSRGLIRGEGETDADFAARLPTWLDKWRSAGSAEAIATAIHDYCANHPQVRIVTRSGYWVTLNADGTMTRQQATWDWDSVSNPERAGYWSEIWVIVYPSTYAIRGNWGGGGTWGGDDYGVGQDVSRVAFEAIKGLVQQWKAAHTKVRTLIWSYDATLFDPGTPSSLPDGNWGKWGKVVNGVVVPSRSSSARYWEWE